jgi:choline dehydrogenase
MLWVRGNRADFDRWAQMGARDWSDDDVLPHFRAIESYAPGDPVLRGKDGPVDVLDYNTVNPLTHAFVAAARHVGFPMNPDLSGENPAEGVGYSQMSRDRRWRASTARAFLRRARGR